MRFHVLITIATVGEGDHKRTARIGHRVLEPCDAEFMTRNHVYSLGRFVRKSEGDHCFMCIHSDVIELNNPEWTPEDIEHALKAMGTPAWYAAPPVFAVVIGGAI